MSDDRGESPESDAVDGTSPGPTRIAAAAEAVASGDLVVYPTETVYGLGADALDIAAIDRVYAVKRRSREDPPSLAGPTLDAALAYGRVSAFERDFINALAPGPVTVVVERQPVVPDALTGGRDRVGIRVPDHPVAQELLEAAAPVTATSANVSGQGSVTDPSELDAAIRSAAAVVLDAGPTPGTESTVVDPDRGVIHRRGAMADAVQTWLDERRRDD